MKNWVRPFTSLSKKTTEVKGIYPVYSVYAIGYPLSGRYLWGWFSWFSRYRLPPKAPKASRVLSVMEQVNGDSPKAKSGVSAL